MNSAGSTMKIIGNRSFTGIFCAISSGTLTPLEPQFLGLGAKHVGDRDAEQIGLDHREHEPLELGDHGAFVQLAERVGTRDADQREPTNSATATTETRNRAPVAVSNVGGRHSTTQLRIRSSAMTETT